MKILLTCLTKIMHLGVRKHLSIVSKTLQSSPSFLKIHHSRVMCTYLSYKQQMARVQQVEQADLLHQPLEYLKTWLELDIKKTSKGKIDS